MGTGLGGLIGILFKPNRRIFGFLMGITAGVMITLSFLELVNEAWIMAGYIQAALGFGLGAFFMLAIDYFTPHIRFGEEEIRSGKVEYEPGWQLPHHFKRHRPGWRYRHGYPVNQSLINSGLLIAAGITIHNLPEGLAVGAGFMHSPQFGLFIAVAIALHNIPEGISVSVPIAEATGNRKRAFLYSFAAGLAEPVGMALGDNLLVLGTPADPLPALLDTARRAALQLWNGLALRASPRQGTFSPSSETWIASGWSAYLARRMDLEAGQISAISFWNEMRRLVHQLSQDSAWPDTSLGPGHHAEPP